MLLPKKDIASLLQKQEWTDEERQLMLAYLENSDGTELKDIMQSHFSETLLNSKKIDSVLAQQLLTNIRQRIEKNIKNHKPRVVRMWAMRVAAASIVGILVVVACLWVNNNSTKDITQTNSIKKVYRDDDVSPGTDKAMLTLADGSVIMLDDKQNGALAQQGNTKVIKVGGTLNYQATGTQSNEILYNTIATPRGGQYKVELPDGSKVWLNAASSLRFPTSFSGKARRVEITGEAYFEVVRNKAMPFIVSAKGTEVYVLGTHFNVMAYDDELRLETTLLEGAVKCVKDGNNAMLKPGQQLQLTKDGQLKVVSDVDLSKVMAWKNGFFIFKGLDIETIAKQLSRWYDVEVEYNRKVDDLFYATIPRNTQLSDVLKALELTGKIHFKIEEKKIIVMP